MKKVVLAIAIVAFLATSLSLFVNRDGVMAGTPDASYVAGKKCKMCHIKEFKAHAESLHAMGFESLKDAGQETNAECLACHSTGYGKPGGFADAGSTPDLGGTTCQACHGPGSAHIEKGLDKEQRKALMTTDAKQACVNCHKSHEEHADVGAGVLQKKLERLQAKIKELEG
ncbi:multiheme c-type cytochrome [Candidatus Poribacteria bacterium]